MSLKKYHKEAYGFPIGSEQHFKQGVCDMTYTNHAKKAAENEGYGAIELPQTINFEGREPFEITFKNDIVAKLCYRIEYNDICDLVFSVDGVTNEIITVWLNEKNDSHRTLDKSKYDRP